jgi:hypothetical protein
MARVKGVRGPFAESAVAADVLLDDGGTQWHEDLAVDDAIALEASASLLKPSWVIRTLSGWLGLGPRSTNPEPW